MKKLATVLFKLGVASLVGAAIMVPVTLIALTSIKPPPYFTAVIFAVFLAIGVGLIITSGAIHFRIRRLSKREIIKV